MAFGTISFKTLKSEPNETSYPTRDNQFNQPSGYIPQRGRYNHSSRGSYRNNESYNNRGANRNYDEYDNYNQPKYQRRDSGRGRHGFG